MTIGVGVLEAYFVHRLQVDALSGYPLPILPLPDVQSFVRESSRGFRIREIHLFDSARIVGEVRFIQIDLAAVRGPRTRRETGFLDIDVVQI